MKFTYIRPNQKYFKHMNFYVIVVLLGSFHHLAGIASDNVSYYIIEILRFLFVKQLEGLSVRSVNTFT